jgi:hypothetical protein
VIARLHIDLRLRLDAVVHDERQRDQHQQTTDRL